MSQTVESIPDDGPPDEGELGNAPAEITYDEHLHPPARPRTLRFRPRVRNPFVRRSIAQDGTPTADNQAYVSWLLSQSMLADANEISQQFSGQGSMWQNPPYATPSPRSAVDAASVWFTAYPLSLITRPDESFLKAMADEAMWKPSPKSALRASTPGRSNVPVASRAGNRPPPASTATSTASAPRSTRHSAPKTNSARCAAPRTGTAARFSMTSCPATPVRAPTSAWRR